MFRCGDILAYVDNSLQSKIIRFLSKGLYSHVGMALNETQLIEAVPTGIRIRNIIQDKEENIYHYKLKDEYYNLIMKNIYTFNSYISFYIGKRYGYLSAVKAWLDVYFPKIRFKDTKHLCCSALIAKLDAVCGILLTQNVDEYTPTEICKEYIYEFNKIVNTTKRDN